MEACRLRVFRAPHDGAGRALRVETDFAANELLPKSFSSVWVGSRAYGSEKGLDSSRRRVGFPSVCGSLEIGPGGRARTVNFALTVIERAEALNRVSASMPRDLISKV
jgi:hypothetical protein